MSEKAVYEHNSKQVSNQIEIFKNPEFGSIRTLEIKGEPWFVGKDVAEILGYAKPLNAIATHVDKDDSLKQGLTDNLGRLQQAIFINESGLYSLILSSKLPSAKKFKRWVTSEVIPSIRKHGAYMTPETIEKVLYNPDLIIQLASSLKSKQEENKELLTQNQELKSENLELQTVNKTLVEEIQKWDYQPLIRKLINRYSMAAVNGVFGVGWKRFYDEL